MKQPVHEHGEIGTDGLTKNQILVLDALTDAGGPLSAYGILDQLREHGFRAPLQVYRALEKLVDQGRVHRLESLNAFVACRHPGCESQEAVIFAICTDCGNVDEMTDAGLGKKLHLLASEVEFSLAKSTVELRGLCCNCSGGKAI